MVAVTQRSLAGSNAEDWDSLSQSSQSAAKASQPSENEGQNTGGPWPSKANRTDLPSGEKSVSTAGPEKTEDAYARIAREFVKDAEEDLEGRILRAVAASGDTRLRREAVRERRGQPGSYRAKELAGVMQRFLSWFLEQDDLELQFPGFTVKAGSSYDEDAARGRYGELSDYERGAYDVCRESGSDLYTALYGLTASHKNANGKYRCPADFWQEMIGAWSNHVRQEQQRVFDEFGADRYDPDADYQRRSAIGYVLDGDPTAGRWWEYARIVEPQKSGYPHVHVAIATNFEIAVEDFEPVIERHVEETPSANWAAHDMYADDPHERCVSVNRVDPETEDRDDAVGNLASYLSSYLSEFSDDEEGDEEYTEMLDRSAHEVMFASIQWATGSRKIDFSNGAHSLKDRGYDLRPDEYKPPESDGTSDPPTTVKNMETGEEHAILEAGSVEMVSVEARPGYDPEKVFVGGLEATR